MGLAELQAIRANRDKPKEKKIYKIPKVSKKRQAKLNEQAKAGTDSESDVFFSEMLKRCTGRCTFCGDKTTAKEVKLWRDDKENWSEEANDKAHERKVESLRRASIAHLLPKRPVDKGGFPSVATNENNWVELCWSCHAAFDSGKISWLMLKDSAEWELLKEKLLLILPLVTPEEQKNKLYALLIELIYENK